jgi:hypothetical protein
MTFKDQSSFYRVNHRGCKFCYTKNNIPVASSEKIEQDVFSILSGINLELNKLEINCARERLLDIDAKFEYFEQEIELLFESVVCKLHEFEEKLLNQISTIEKKATRRKRKLPRFKSNQFLFRTTLKFKVPLHYVCGYNGLSCNDEQHITEQRITVCARTKIDYYNEVYEPENDKACNKEGIYCVKCWWIHPFLRHKKLKSSCQK